MMYRKSNLYLFYLRGLSFFGKNKEFILYKQLYFNEILDICD